MSAIKTIEYIDNVEVKTTTAYSEVYTGLVDGSHIYKVEIYNGTVLKDTKIKNFTKVAVVYDVDYQAVLDAVVAAGDPLPSTAQQDIDNQLMIDYKATGGWAKDDVVFKFSGTGSIGYKLMCWKRLVKAEAFGSLIWSDSGVKGNGTNAYIKSGYNPALNALNMTQNDASINYVGVEAPNTEGIIVGGYTGSAAGLINWGPNKYFGDPYYALNGVGTPRTSKVLKVGLNGLYRLSSSSLKVIGSSEISITGTSGELNNIELYILARNYNEAINFWDEKISFLTIGGNKYSMHAAMASVLE